MSDKKYPFHISPNKPKGICPAYRCKNPKGDKKKFCHKHNARAHKHRRPASYTFTRLKTNAKRRGIEVNMTLMEFEIWCAETGYLETKGKASFSSSIDRIDPSVGYEIGNIQIMSLSENTKKMHRDNAPDDLPF